MAEHCRKLSWLPCHCAGIERQRMAMAEQMSGSMPAGFSFTRRRAAWTLGILLIVYTLNYADRVIISTIGEAIRIDLKLSDTQLGLLGGLALDRKSTRLNSITNAHLVCRLLLEKKNTKT